MFLLNSIKSEKEKLGFFPDVPEVECKCSINVKLKGEQREMTWSDNPGI